MLTQRIYETLLSCDKCGRIIRGEIHILSDSFIEKYSKKKIFCGRCIQARLHRNDPDWDYDKEFAYERPEISEEEKAFLKLLLRGMC